MEKDLTLDDLKNVARKLGFHVSEIKPKGPVHMLFLEQFSKIYLHNKDGHHEDISNDHKFEKFVIEYYTMIFKDIKEFENNLLPRYDDYVSGKYNTKQPIFSFYTLHKDSDGYRVRFSCLDQYFGEMKEISKERAKEILSKRESSKYKVSFEFYEDLKVVYDL